MAHEGGPSRREVMQGIGAAVGAAAVGCGDGSNAAGPDAGTGGADASASGPDAARPATVDAGRLDAGAPDASAPDAGAPDGGALACGEPSGLSASELLGEIETIVVLCMENRSFDHYFGSLTFKEGRTDVAGLLGTETNPAPGGGDPVGVFRLEDYEPDDPPHGWDACHRQWNGGLNDQFVIEHAGGSQHQVMGYHERDQLPALYTIADHAALCDHWHCSLLGPTWPNRYYLHGATSLGAKTNVPAFGFRDIFSELGDAGITHRNYMHDVAWATGGYFKLTGLSPIEDFFTDAATGTLPQFSIIDPSFFGAGANDDHPDHNIQLGQALIASVFAACGASPQWDKMLFVITYDEHGGFFDHVAPPTTVDERDDFRQLGFRVPSVVSGGYARRGCVVSDLFEHSSVVATATTRFGLTPLNDRVTASADLSPCINPDYFGDPQPAPELPPVEISMSALTHRVVDPNRHSELRDAVDRMNLPRHLDRRSESLDIARRWLRHGERLGAVRLTR